MKYKPLNPEIFKLNRKRFINEMKPNSVAIFNSNDMMPRNGDCFFPFRQNSDLFYLSGIDQEESILLLFPDCVKEDCREILFVKKTNEHIAIWEGHKYTKPEARETSGVERIIWLDDMNVLFNELILLADNVYLNSNENDRYDSGVFSRDLRFAHKMKKQYPLHNYVRSQPIMKKLAMIKSRYEIEVLQEAVDITEKAFRRICGFIKPGVMEYEIEAEITHEFIRNAANGHAYTPIIASGANANVLHYIDNNQECKDGDLILMDFGAEYGNYAADLSRTIPVNGRYTNRQKDVYNACLKVMKEATEMLVPGTTLDEYHKEVGKVMESELIGLGLLDKQEVARQNPDKPLYKEYFMHGTSHHLGLDVHDLCHRYVPFQAGMVFTVEPGIYIPKEGIGVRIENDVLVTDNNPVDLMAKIPREVDEIESLMNSKQLIA